jgi:hypothetical protein
VKLDMEKPVGLRCEAANCGKPATHVYGPECEAETGKLMYLCAGCTMLVTAWKASHLNDPVECKTHGRIGPVKNYLILKAI